MKMYLLHKMGDFPASKKLPQRVTGWYDQLLCSSSNKKQGGWCLFFAVVQNKPWIQNFIWGVHINMIVINMIMVVRCQNIIMNWRLLIFNASMVWLLQTFTKTRVIICVRIVWIRSTWVCQTSHCYPKKCPAVHIFKLFPILRGIWRFFHARKNQQPSKWYILEPVIWNSFSRWTFLGMLEITTS